MDDPDALSEGDEQLLAIDEEGFSAEPGSGRQRSRGQHHRPGFDTDTDADFDNFVRESTLEAGRLAFVLTGDAALAEQAVARGFARVRGNWPRLSAAQAQQQLRESVAQAALKTGGCTADLDALDATGWPEIRVAPGAVTEQVQRGRTRRNLLVGLGAVAGLGLAGWGGWELIGAIRHPDDPRPDTDAIGELVSTDTVHAIGDDTPFTLDRLTLGQAEAVRLRADGQTLALLPLGRGQRSADLVHPRAPRRVFFLVEEPARWVHAALGDGVERLTLRRVGDNVVGIATVPWDMGRPQYIVGRRGGEVDFPEGLMGVAAHYFERAGMMAYTFTSETPVLVALKSGAVRTTTISSWPESMMGVRLEDGTLVSLISNVNAVSIINSGDYEVESAASEQQSYFFLSRPRRQTGRLVPPLVRVTNLEGRQSEIRLT